MTRRRIALEVLLAVLLPVRAARRIASLERCLDASMEAHVIAMIRHYEREHPGESPWTEQRHLHVVR